MADIHTLADRVLDTTAAPVERDVVLNRLTPIVQEFNVEPDELVTTMATALENEYIADGGAIVEWNDTTAALDPRDQ